jgi:hypothetical protein
MQNGAEAGESFEGGGRKRKARDFDGDRADKKYFLEN